MRKKTLLLVVLIVSALLPATHRAQTVFRQVYDTPVFDEAHALMQTTDGGYIFTGTTAYDTEGGLDVWTVKTDAQGVHEWTLTHGRTKDDRGLDIVQTTDGGYVVVGWSQHEDWVIEVPYIVKIDASGVVAWEKKFSGNPLTSVIATPDGGFVVTGDRMLVVMEKGWPAMRRHVLLEAYDASGEVLWTRGFRKGTSHNQTTDNQYGQDLIQTADGGYLISGRWMAYEAFLIKTDADGHEVWRKSYTFDFQVADGLALRATSDGGFIVAGHRGDNPIVFKINSQGEQEWFYVYTVTDPNWQHFSSVVEMPDGSFLLAGPFLDTLVKVSARGRLVALYPVWGAGGHPEVIRTDDGGYAILCQFDYDSGAHVGLVKTDANMVLTAIEMYEAGVREAFFLEQNHPNPFNLTTTIAYEIASAAPVRLTVYDVLGREVTTLVNGAMKTPGHYEVTWETEGLPAGLYLYRLYAGPHLQTRTMTLLR